MLKFLSRLWKSEAPEEIERESEASEEIERKHKVIIPFGKGSKTCTVNFTPYGQALITYCEMTYILHSEGCIATKLGDPGNRRNFIPLTPGLIELIQEGERTQRHDKGTS